MMSRQRKIPFPKTPLSTPRTRAFTLIELLVVVSIIALLISILLPSLQSAKDQSQKVKCMSNLKQFGTGFFAYSAGDSKGTLCSGQPDFREGYNYPKEITDQEVIGMDRVGWIADLVNIMQTRPGEMMCPTNPGRIIQNYDVARRPPGVLDQVKFEQLMKEGYNTNYGQSWFMAHTEFNATNTPLVVDKDKSYAASGTVRGDLGPLYADRMSRAAAGLVPLLADGRADPDDSFTEFGMSLRETKAVTDGPNWLIDENGKLTEIPYTKTNPYGSQDLDDLGVAHGRRGNFLNSDQHNATTGNVLFGDGHVDSFKDRFKKEDGKEQPDGQLDIHDTRGRLFDGVLTLGRRSLSTSQKL